MTRPLPRYSSLIFPSYRFIPGENPHPTEDPQGHSYGRIDPEITITSPEQWRENELYLFGIDLYNHYYWWEAHESLEGLWKACREDVLTRDFLQGLIKIAGAYIKWHSKKHRGVQTLYRGGHAHLKKTAEQQEVFMGLNITDHLYKLEKHFAPVLESSGPWSDPRSGYPYIILDPRIDPATDAGTLP